MVIFYKFKIYIHIFSTIYSVENRRSKQMEIFGRELVKKKQAGECLPQIVEFGITGLVRASILKNHIRNMTKYEPKTRITTEQTRLELQKLCSWTGTYISGICRLVFL